MPRPNSRRDQQHLKNLRRLRKEARAPKVSGKRGKKTGGSKTVVNLGLALTGLALVLLIGSALMQIRQKPSGRAESGAVALDPSTVEVRVLNGCGVAGAGRVMTVRLRDLGFDVVSSGNAENFSYPNTLVIGHTDRAEAAQAVAQALGCNHVSAQLDDFILVDVTVILGQDWEQFVGAEQGKQTAGRLKKFFSRAWTKTRALLESK